LPLDQKLLGQKLQRCRNQFDRTVAEVSEATGISQERLQAYEAGTSTPSGDEILIFADYYMCDYEFFISNEKLAPFEETETMFRRYGDEFSRDDRWVVQEFLFLSECEHSLQKDLGKETHTRFKFTPGRSTPARLGELAAIQLRAHQGYPGNGVPLDIYKDFRSIGLHVFRRKLRNSNISGLFVNHPVAGGCILINYDEDVYRQRFTAAHEACHAILDSDDGFVVSLGSQRQRDVEIRANKFSSHYLAPSSFLHAIPEARNWNTTKAIEWANKLKVSTEVLAYALSRERLVNPSTMNVVKSVRVPKRDKIDPEIPSSLAPQSQKRKRELLERGLSNYYVGLCFQGYREEMISAARLAEMLLLEGDAELVSLADLYGERLRYGK
jgi:Zn-dependent peptidase ImmA (M78 family)/transcriptional regulator with XRE-family HTH domain